MKAVSSLGTEPFGERKGDVRWTLDIGIPAGALWKSGLKSWDGLKASANNPDNKLLGGHHQKLIN